MENSVKSDAEGARRKFFVNLSGKRTKGFKFILLPSLFSGLGYFILRRGFYVR